MNALGENKTFYLCIIKLVLSQSESAAKIKLPNARHLHRNGHTFNREMHLYGLHNQRCVCLLKSAFGRFISYVCERVHCCDVPQCLKGANKCHQNAIYTSLALSWVSSHDTLENIGDVCVNV